MTGVLRIPDIAVMFKLLLREIRIGLSIAAAAPQCRLRARQGRLRLRVRRGCTHYWHVTFTLDYACDHIYR